MFTRNPKAPVGYTIRAVIALAGGAAAVCRACNLTACRNWTYIPDAHLKTVAAMSGIPFDVLRPDLAYTAAQE
jgi:hypothetical protein